MESSVRAAYRYSSCLRGRFVVRAGHSGDGPGVVRGPDRGEDRGFGIRACVFHEHCVVFAVEVGGEEVERDLRTYYWWFGGHWVGVFLGGGLMFIL